MVDSVCGDVDFIRGDNRDIHKISQSKKAVEILAFS